MKNFIVLGMVCLMFFAVNPVEAYSYGNAAVPVMQTTVTETENGATVTYSRPVIYAGSKMVKRPPYYKECKKKLGFWDENICAQYYLPKLIEEKLGGDD